MTLANEIITSPSRLAEIEPQWESLLERAAVNTPTLAPFWQRAWWDVFGAQEGRRLRAIAMYDGDRLVGLAPLLWRRHWYRPGIPLRRLELVASGEPQQDEIYSEYNGVLAERGMEDTVARALVDVIDSRDVEVWDELELPALSGDSPMVGALERALNDAGHPTQIDAQDSAAYIPLPSTWERYLASLSSPSRYLVNRSLRDLDAWAKRDLVYERARSPEALARGSAILKELHGVRWGGTSGEGGAFQSEPFCAFHDQVMQWLLERERLELSWISVRGVPIAALYNFVWDNKVHHYQSGRRLDLPKQIRPGIAIHAFAIRHAIEEGRREYDFLGGEGQHKDKLALAQRPLLHVTATRGPTLDIARRFARRGLDGARAVQRRIRDMWKTSEVSHGA